MVLLGMLLFPWWLVAVELVLVVALWGLLESPKASKVSLWTWWGMMGLVLGSRLMIFAWSTMPFGYDTGLYRHELWQSFQALPEYVSGLFLGLPLLGSVFQLFGGTVDGFLLGAPVLFSVLVAAAIVVYMRQAFGDREALIAGGLFALSVVQWQAFEMILLKQILALALVMLSFWLMERRSWWSLVVLAFLALLQPLELVFVGVAVLVMGVLRRGFYLQLTVLGFASGIALLVLEPGFWLSAWDLFLTGLLSPGQLEASLQQGVFLGFDAYGYQGAFFFTLGLLGAVWQLKKRGWTLLHGYGLALLIWILIGLFFSQRLLISLDLVLLLFSATVLVALCQKERVLGVTLLLSCALPMGGLISHFEPLIEVSEWQQIQETCSDLPSEAFILATDSAYASWLRGYCLDQRVIAPGMFEWNQWSKDQWISFWRGENRAELLEAYEGELWLYVGKKQPALEMESDLFEEIGEGWWKKR